MIIGHEEFLHPQETQLIKDLLMEYEQIFAFETAHLGRLNPDIEPPVTIHTVAHNPWQKRQMKLSERGREILTEIVRDRLKNGLLESCMGPYRNQYFLVPKKDGKWRLICDLQPCNKVTIKDSAVPPNTDEISQAIAGAVCYSGGDMYSGYNGITLDESSRDITAIMTPLGLVRYTTLPEGFTNSVAIYQRIMCKIFAKWIGRKVWVFVDDFGIKGPTDDYGNETDKDGIRLWVSEHVNDLRGIFGAILDSGLTLNALKCFFCVPKLEMLSFVCHKDGRTPTKKKLEKIWNWKPCTNLTEARGFVGLCVCFRKWIKDFIHILAPIYELSKKNVKFKWGAEQQKAMDTIKEKFTEELILMSPNHSPGAPMFVLTTDAGPNRWGAVLMQPNEEGELRPIEFLSGFFSEVEKRYDQLKREALALCNALRKLKYYVHGRKFKVETDAASLVWLLNQVPSDLPNAVMTRWLTWLRLFDFEAKHIKGKTNIIADSLSRKPFDEEDNDDTDIEDYLDTEDGIIAKSGGEMETDSQNHKNRSLEDGKMRICRLVGVISDATNESDESDGHMTVRSHHSEDTPGFKLDEYLGELRDIGIYKATLRLPAGATPQKTRLLKRRAKRYVLENGHLYEIISAAGLSHAIPKRVISLPERKKDIVRRMHVGLVHKGREATFQAISERFVWRGMFSDVEQYCKTCEECQKRSRQRNPGLLHAQFTPTVFSRINMDSVKIGSSDLSSDSLRQGFVNAHSCILARDDLSGWIEGRAIADGEAATVARFFLEDIIFRHGIPYRVVNDGGTEFMGEFKNLLERFGVQQTVTAAYHPQSAGMIERGHKPVLDALSKLSKGKSKEWPLHLASVLWADRITTKRTTGMTPFYMVYGRHCLQPVHLSEASFDLIEWSMVRTTSDLITARAQQIEMAEEMRGIGQLRVNEAREKSAEDKNNNANLRPTVKELINQDIVLLHNTEKERQYGDKLRYYWRGPYRISKEGGQRTWRLFELDGTPLKGLYNEDRLKKYEYAEEDPLDDLL